MDETISLQEIFGIIKKRFLLILSLTLITALLAAGLSYYVLTPLYQSSTQFIVNEGHKNKDPEFFFDQNTIRTNIDLINTYTVIITSSAILDDVIKELELPYSMDDLKKNINVTSEEDSQVVTVTVKDPNAEQATDIANTTVRVFQTKIPDIMSVNNVSILSEAVTPEKPLPVEPNPLINISIAAVLGMVIGLGLTFLLAYLDTKIHNEDDVRTKLDVPVLGMISTIERKDIRKDAWSASKKKNKGESHVQTKKTGVS